MDEAVLYTSKEFQMIEEFNGVLVKHLYDHNKETFNNFKEAEKDACKEFNQIRDPPVKDSAMKKIKMRKIREKVREENKTKRTVFI